MMGGSFDMTMRDATQLPIHDMVTTTTTSNKNNNKNNNSSSPYRIDGVSNANFNSNRPLMNQHIPKKKPINSSNTNITTIDNNYNLSNSVAQRYNNSGGDSSSSNSSNIGAIPNEYTDDRILHGDNSSVVAPPSTSRIRIPSMYAGGSNDSMNISSTSRHYDNTAAAVSVGGLSADISGGGVGVGRKPIKRPISSYIPSSNTNNNTISNNVMDFMAT